MEDGEVRLRIGGLTELDRLELEKAVASCELQIERQRTPDGQLGEPGALEAILTFGIAALPVIAGALGLWLSHGSRRSLLKDEFEMETPHVKIRRKLLISSRSSDEIKAEVVKQLTDMAAFARASEPPGGAGVK